MKAKPILVVCGLCALALLSAVEGAWAEMSGGGHVSFAMESSETFELGNGKSARRSVFSGVVIGNEPDNPFHMGSQDCFGTYVLGDDGQVEVAQGFCDGIDKEGDVWWLWWTEDPTGLKWKLTGGTGKFEGLTGGGETQPGAQWGDGKFVSVWQGTWTMK
jgi:hypothetical protein